MTHPILRLFKRLLNSASKRLFWRSHLQDAINQMECINNTLTTPEMFMSVPMAFRGKGYYRSLELKQNMNELLGLINILKSRNLNQVCEIGTFKGGTLYIWCQLADFRANIHSIDLPGGGFGGGYNERSLPFFQSFRKSGQKLNCLRGDSHNHQVKLKFQSLLGEQQLDFLFIDGDHSYQGVKQDFEDYKEFVRPGGIIAFHDIVERRSQPDIEVWRFWSEIKKAYRSQEFIDPSPDKRTIGIGVIYID